MKILGIMSMILAVFFLIIANQFNRKKWLHLLAGNTFNDLPKKVEEKVRKESIVISVIMGIYFLIVALSYFLKIGQKIVLVLTGFLFFLGIIILIKSLSNWIKTGY